MDSFHEKTYIIWRGKVSPMSDIIKERVFNSNWQLIDGFTYVWKLFQVDPIWSDFERSIDVCCNRFKDINMQLCGEKLVELLDNLMHFPGSSMAKSIQLCSIILVTQIKYGNHKKATNEARGNNFD